MAFGHDSNSAQWFETVDQAAAHQPGCDEMNWGFKNRPAPTVTGGSSHGASGIEIFDQQSRWKLVRQIEAGEANGNGRIVNPKTPLDPIRLLPSEAAALQTYPAGFEFSGNKGEVFQQIGNAVPVLLEQAVLEALWAIPAADLELAA